MMKRNIIVFFLGKIDCVKSTSTNCLFVRSMRLGFLVFDRVIQCVLQSVLECVLQCVAGCVYAIELLLQTKLSRHHFCKTDCPARAFVHTRALRVWRMCVCDEVCCGVFQYVAECCSCNIFCSIYTYIVCMHVHTFATRVTLYGRCSTFQKFCATDYYAEHASWSSRWNFSRDPCIVTLYSRWVCVWNSNLRCVEVWYCGTQWVVVIVAVCIYIIYVCKYTYMYMYMCMYMYMYLYICVCVYIYTYIYTYMYTYMYIRKYIYIYIYM